MHEPLTTVMKAYLDTKNTREILIDTELSDYYYGVSYNLYEIDDNRYLVCELLGGAGSMRLANLMEEITGIFSAHEAMPVGWLVKKEYVDTFGDIVAPNSSSATKAELSRALMLDLTDLIGSRGIRSYAVLAVRGSV